MSDEVDYERIARESIAYRRSPTQEQKDRDMRVFGKIRDRKPYNFESFSKRLKYQNRHSPAALWNEISISDDKERYLEELRRQHQAKLSRRLHRETAKRLGVTMPVDDRSDLITSVTAATKNNQHLQLSRNSMQLRVSIHPYTVRGHHRKLEMGTLQAHANGFRFSNYSIPLLMDVMYDNIKHAFYQDGDERMAPFLHLNLHNPIMLGTETTKDIQFRLVQTSAGSRRKGPLARDSDKLDKERQETVDNQMNKLDKLMHKFVWEVNSLWGPLASNEFEMIERCHGFHANLPMKKHTPSPSFLVMTLDCLVHLSETPFFVLTLEETEIVNLVRTQSGPEVFNMTFVFKDFGLDVCHINAISSEHLLQIKQWLDARRVKYYENEQDISNWRTQLKTITDEPENFIEHGGWGFLNSGEDATEYSDSSEEGLARYNMTLEDSDGGDFDIGPENKEKCMTQTIRRVNVVMSDESDS